MWWFVLYFILGCCISGSIGAVLADWKNRDRVEGFVLCFFLGVLGIAILSLLSSGGPRPAAGRYRAHCPYCDAAQNLTSRDEYYRCWQCDQTTIVDWVGEPDSSGKWTVECPACDKKAKVNRDSIRYTCGCGKRHNLALA